MDGNENLGQLFIYWGIFGLYTELELEGGKRVCQ